MTDESEAVRLARLEEKFDAFAATQKAENEARRERHHRLANETQGIGGSLRTIAISLARLEDVPARLEKLEAALPTKLTARALDDRLKAFGMDPDKPAETSVVIKFAGDLRRLLASAGRHGLFGIITLAVGGVTTGLWKLFQGQAAHP